MKLKTLKDMKAEEDDWEAEDNIPKSKLKAEAIKRWKYAKKRFDLIKNKDDNFITGYYKGKMEEIEDNFNITEEDLK